MSESNLMASVEQARSRLQSTKERLSEAKSLCTFGNFASGSVNKFQSRIPIEKWVEAYRKVFEWNVADGIVSAGEILVKKLTGTQSPDDKRLKYSKGSNYAADFKDKWVREHSQLILEAAAKYNLPPELVAGVIWQEAGILPDETDFASYTSKKVNPLLEYLESTPLNEIDYLNRFLGSEEKASFGQIQMQIGTAAKEMYKELGYEKPEDLPENLSTAQETVIIRALIEPATSIELAARHLDTLRSGDGLPSNPDDMSDEDIRAVATQYSEGDKKLEEIDDKNSGYGEGVLDLRENTRKLLEE